MKVDRTGCLDCGECYTPTFVGLQSKNNKFQYTLKQSWLDGWKEERKQLLLVGESVTAQYEWKDG